MTVSTFQQFGLNETITRAIDLLNYTTPTSVQVQVIPLILDHEDVIVQSSTGSGKTASFAIPLCQMIQWDQREPQVLVLTPTRELAMQVGEDFFNIGRFKRVKVVTVFGKSPFGIQKRQLQQKTHVVVGTPGRLLDHMDKGTLDLSKIRYLVIDEADEMLNMGFLEDIEAIIAQVPIKRNTAVFSATMPEDIRRLCELYMQSPKHIELLVQATEKSIIEQRLFQAEEKHKFKAMENLIIIENPSSLMVFCNTQVRVESLYKALAQNHEGVSRIHGGMEQSDRIQVMQDFKRGKIKYLVATNVAARGIDVDQIGLVINYDVPEKPENYVHRIGRTGRIGNCGRAFTLVSKKEETFLKDIQTLIGQHEEYSVLPSLEAVSSAESLYWQTNSMPLIKKEDKGEKLNEGILKIHINAGKKTKMRAVDIVGTLCSLEGMTAEDIGIINIMDISTYVEILNGKGEMVYNALQNKPIKGRIRKVSKSILNQ